MVDVEQHALCALEQDSPPATASLVEVAPHRPGERKDEVGDFGQVVEQTLAVDRRLAETGAECVVVRAQAVEQRSELPEMGEVAHPDRAAADLVLVGGADAAARRADLAGARSIFAQAVEVAVDGQDQRARLSDPQDFRRDFDALLADALNLGFERPRIEHDAIADDRRRAADDAARQQRELVGLVSHDERVAGVVAALEADHHVGAARQPVDDLALAFVAPLGADDGTLPTINPCFARPAGS